MNLFVFILSCLCVVFAAPSNKNSKPKTSEDIGLAKLKQIEALEANSANGIIIFETKQYLDFVEKNPRPYDIVLLWNVEPGSLCDHCITVEGEYNQMVYSFLKERGLDKQHSEKKIFFGIIRFKQDKDLQNLFKKNELMTVPFLTVSPMDLKRDPNQESLFQTENKWLVGANEVFDANKQIEFVNNILRTDVKIKFPFTTILWKNFLGLCIIGLLF